MSTTNIPTNTDYNYQKTNIQYLTNENSTYNQKYTFMMERIKNVMNINGVLFYLFYFSFFIFFGAFFFASRFHWFIKLIIFMFFMFYPFYIFNLELAIFYIYKYLYGIINGIPYDNYTIDNSL